jgi:poly(3-hydroxybutyrate) depolymerase
MEWLDFFTPVNFKSTKQSDDDNCRLLRDYSDDEKVNRAKWAWNISKQVPKEYCSEFGRTFQVDITDRRFFVVHEPFINDKKQKSLPLLIFYHGLNSSAWYCALVETGWLQLSFKYNFLVVFGQGQGTFYENGPQRDRYSQLGFGDLYWEIEQPKDDFDYLDSLIDYMKKKYSDQLDTDRIYFMGYSNGALFSSNVAVRYGNQIFAALCNHCGGFGGQYNEDKMLQPRNLIAPLPIYILTGVDDDYKESCLKAKNLFEMAHCPVVIDILENRGHSYYIDMEEYIWTQFFLNYKLSPTHKTI